MIKLFFGITVLIGLFILTFWSIATSLIPAFSDYSLNAPTQFIFGVFLLFPVFMVGVAVLVLRRGENHD